MDSRLAACVAVLTSLAAVAVDRAQGEPAEIPREFKHFSFETRGHVQEGWLAGKQREVWRDCRQCHDFRQAEPSRPQAVCATCHAGGGFRLATAPGSGEDLGAIHDASSVGGFVHTDHLNLECRACHSVDLAEEREARGRGWLPERMPVPRGGYAVCAPCHDPLSPPDLTGLVLEGRSLSNEDPTTLEAGFLDALNGSPDMGPERLGPFLHADHLADLDAALPLARLVEAGPETDCGDCHAPAFTWKAKAAPRPEYDLASCGECHVGAGREPIGFGAAPDPTPAASAALHTFDHDDHLSPDAIGAAAQVGGVATADGYAAIGSNGCLACHLHSAEVEDYVVAAPLLAGAREPHPASSYEGCVACHAVDAWRTADGLHGDWGRATEENRAGACTGCHAFGVGDMKEERRTVKVRRPRPRSFLIVGQSHPWITADGGEVDAACKECHKAPVARLPSRLGGRAFDHGTHLPDEDVGQDSCTVCHPGVAGTSSPAAIALTYDANACATCHRGAELRPDIPPPDDVDESDVLAFPHDRHTKEGLLGPTGEPITCITCHRPGDWSSPSIGIAPDARGCAKCHDHAAEGELWRVTGFARGHEVESCGKCHDEAVPAIAPPAADFPLARTTIASIDGTQIHPPAQACKTCHIQRPSRPWIPPGPLVGTHREELANGVSDLHEGRRFRGRPCIECHFSGGQTGWSDDPTTRANRARWGGPDR